MARTVYLRIKKPEYLGLVRFYFIGLCVLLSTTMAGCFSLDDFDFKPIFCDATRTIYGVPGTCPMPNGQALRCVDQTYCELPDLVGFERIRVENGCRGTVQTPGLTSEDRIHGGCQLTNCPGRSEPFYSMQSRSLVVEGNIDIRQSTSTPSGVLYLGALGNQGANGVLWIQGNISASGRTASSTEPGQGSLVILDAGSQGSVLVNEGVDIESGCLCARGGEIQGLRCDREERGPNGEYFCARGTPLPRTWLAGERDDIFGSESLQPSTEYDCSGDGCECTVELCRTLANHFRNEIIICE